jgi:Transposase DDE domain
VEGLARTTRGGQPRYSALAITAALTLRAVFRLALRQTEGMAAAIVHHLARLGITMAWPGVRPKWPNY